LAVPVLIFAVSAIDAAALSAPTQPHLMLLGAVLAATTALAPWAAAAALRQAVT
jgi:heme exporter protein B